MFRAYPAQQNRNEQIFHLFFSTNQIYPKFGNFDFNFENSNFFRPRCIECQFVNKEKKSMLDLHFLTEIKKVENLKMLI